MPRKSASSGKTTEGSVASRLASKWSTGEKDANGPVWDWSEMSPQLMMYLVEKVSEHAGAVMLGVDRQRFGGTVSIYVQGERVFHKWYNARADGYALLAGEIEAFLEDLAAL